MTKGIKSDQNKSRLDLIPARPLIEIGRVLAFGAKKYAVDNWQVVPDAKARYTAALLRHVFEWVDGEELDDDSGMHHLAHAGCNVLFLLWFELVDQEPAPSEGLCASAKRLAEAINLLNEARDLGSLVVPFSPPHLDVTESHDTSEGVFVNGELLMPISGTFTLNTTDRDAFTFTAPRAKSRQDSADTEESSAFEGEGVAERSLFDGIECTASTETVHGVDPLPEHRQRFARVEEESKRREEEEASGTERRTDEDVKISLGATPVDRIEPRHSFKFEWGDGESLPLAVHLYQLDKPYGYLRLVGEHFKLELKQGSCTIECDLPYAQVLDMARVIGGEYIDRVAHRKLSRLGFREQVNDFLAAVQDAAAFAFGEES